MTTEEPKGSGLLSRFDLPQFLGRDSASRRLVGLAVFGTGTVFGIGLLVLGVGLVAAGLVVMLNGFGVVEVALDDELGTSLAVGLIIAVLGAFALGLGVESPAGHGYLRVTASPWEVALAHLPGIVVFVLLVNFLRSLVERIIDDLPEAFALVPAYLSAVSSGAVTAAIIGLPVLWAVHQFLVPREERFEDLAPAVVFIAWAIGTALAFQGI
jgi:hypothetical protein